MPSIDKEDATIMCNVERCFPTVVSDAVAAYGWENPTEPFSVWLRSQREARPHWFMPEPKTPSEEDEDAAVFTSADAQAAFMKEHGREALAAKLAERGLTIGRTLKPTKATASDADETPSKNPWSAKYKGKDPEGHRLRVIKSSTKLASQLARAAGVTLTGQPLRGA